MTDAPPPGAPAPAPAPRWPEGWALPVIASPATTAPTRRALLARLDAAPPAAPRFFGADAFETFQAACARLVPSTGLAEPVDVAWAIDARLADGGSDGWRYATLPPDGEAFQAGVAALDAAAAAAHAERFCDLSGAQQDALLADAQHARGPFAAALPAGFDAANWFADWLAEASGLFYGHPLVQESIGYAGFADAGPGSPGGPADAPAGAPGWTRIGLDEREDREPDPLTP